MKPKEKAEELIYNFKTPLDIVVPNYAIKRNAVICVDEIIKVLKHIYKDWEELSGIKYWEEVKQEIKKL